MKKNKFLPLAALLCVAALFLGLYLVTRPEPAVGSKTITVEVVHSDETAKTFTYHSDEEYLGDVLLSEGLVEGEEGPYGLYIRSVDGERADFALDGAYWALFEGEDYATLGIDQTVMEDGDCFRLVYTIG